MLLQFFLLQLRINHYLLEFLLKISQYFQSYADQLTYEAQYGEMRLFWVFETQLVIFTLSVILLLASTEISVARRIFSRHCS